MAAASLRITHSSFFSGDRRYRHQNSKGSPTNALEAKYGTEPIEFELWKIGHEKNIYTERPTKDLYECLSHNYETEISQGRDPVVASKRSFIAANKPIKSHGRTRLGGPGLEAPKLLKLRDKLTQSQEENTQLKEEVRQLKGEVGQLKGFMSSTKKKIE